MGETPAAIDPGTLIVFCVVVGAFAATVIGAVIKYHYDRRKLKKQKYTVAGSTEDQSSSPTAARELNVQQQQPGTEMTAV